MQIGVRAPDAYPHGIPREVGVQNLDLTSHPRAWMERYTQLQEALEFSSEDTEAASVSLLHMPKFTVYSRWGPLILLLTLSSLMIMTSTDL